MKSAPSANQKSASKPKSKKRKTGNPSASSKTLPVNPFRDLQKDSANLLTPLLTAIEQELKLRGLDPSEIRSLDASGAEFHMTVNHTISVMIGVLVSENREQLLFTIHADLGRARRVPERAFLLEAMLGINLSTRESFRLALTQNDCIRLLYSARVFDQMKLGSVGETLDQIVSRATHIRNQLSGQRVFQELHSSDETDEKPLAVSDSKGPNGWVQ
jgi:hypothetical protein